MAYAALELKFAEPFADELASNPDFRKWVLAKTPHSIYAEDCTVLVDEMREKRSNASTHWWRSFHTDQCSCDGCSGRETDMLAIAEHSSGKRIALHVEVKQPFDTFKPGANQAQAYNTRARCWSDTPPASVVKHGAASTVLLCSASKLAEYGSDCEHFDTVITFEEIASVFPGFYPSHLVAS